MTESQRYLATMGERQISSHESDVIPTPLSLEEIDLLLTQLPPTTEMPNTAPPDATPSLSLDDRAEKVVRGVDQLLLELDQAIELTETYIKGWSLDRKRQEAANTEDEFTHEVLARDENPVVRTLALCNPNTSPELLTSAARSYSAWSQLIAANNPSTSPEVLAELALSDVDDIRQGVRRNPSASEVTRYKLSDQTDQEEADGSFSTRRRRRRRGP